VDIAIMNGVINSKLSFKILYRFLGEDNHHTCQLTYEQYKNFKKLPIIRECIVVKRNQKDLDDYKGEMQNALNLAAQNDITHIQKLSQIVR
jgi:two-component system chemotaxis response regulator CheY